jgi:hypothetical protein
MQGISDVQQNCVSKTSHYRAPSQGRNVRTEPHQTTSKSDILGISDNKTPCHATHSLACRHSKSIPTQPKQPDLKMAGDIRRATNLQYVQRVALKGFCGPGYRKGGLFIVCGCRYSRDGIAKTKRHARLYGDKISGRIALLLKTPKHTALRLKISYLAT